MNNETVAVKLPCGIYLLASLAEAIRVQAQESCMDVAVTATPETLTFTFREEES